MVEWDNATVEKAPKICKPSWDLNQQIITLKSDSLTEKDNEEPTNQNDF